MLKVDTHATFFTWIESTLYSTLDKTWFYGFSTQAPNPESIIQKMLAPKRKADVMGAPQSAKKAAVPSTGTIVTPAIEGAASKDMEDAYSAFRAQMFVGGGFFGGPSSFSFGNRGAVRSAKLQASRGATRAAAAAWAASEHEFKLEDAQGGVRKLLDGAFCGSLPARRRQEKGNEGLSDFHSTRGTITRACTFIAGACR